MIKNILSLKFGGMCAVFVGISYFIYAGIYLFDSSRQSTNAHQFMKLFEQNPRPYMYRARIMAFGSTFALGALPSISALVRWENSDWVQWTSGLAYVGFATMAITNFRALQILPVLLKDYVTADDSVKTALARSSSFIALDPRGWFSYGGVGLWLFVINLVALQKNIWPKGLAYIGIVVSFLYCLVLLGGIFHKYRAFTFIAGIGGLILAPLWYVWIGLILL